jgi:hypothetical protein
MTTRMPLKPIGRSPTKVAIIQMDADEEGNIDPDSLIGPLPGVDEDDR